MNGINLLKMLTTTLLVCLVATAATAQDPTVESVLSSLQNPRGVAVRPGDNAETHQVFVADSGAGRVIKLDSDQPAKSIDVITGFAADAAPRSLLFLDRNSLVVTCDGPPAIRLYQISDQADAQTADSSKQQATTANGNRLVAFARTRANDKVPDALVVAFTAADQPGWLGKIPVRAGTLDELTPLKAADFDTPTGIAVSEQGFLVVSHRGPDDVSKPARLTFINPIGGVPVMELPLDLPGIAALAYSPKTDNLFAIAATTSAANDGGLFRIDSTSQPGKPGCKAVKIAPIKNPTAFNFAPDGALYITATGKSNGSGDKNGSLMKVTGNL